MNKNISFGGRGRSGYGGGGGSGTVTGAANVGTGEGWFKNLVAGILNFKTAKAGRGITAVSSADEVALEALHSNSGAGARVAQTIVGSVAPFRSIVAGANIGVVENVDDITISAAAPGEVNGGANVGTGAGESFRDKTGVTLNFKTIKAGTGVTVVNNANDITLSAAASYFPVYSWNADQVRSPDNADWYLNNLAIAIADTVNASLIVRSFPKASESGIGVIFRIPPGATAWNFSFMGRPAAAPAGGRDVVFYMRSRKIRANVAIGAYDAEYGLGSFPIPANNRFQRFTGVPSIFPIAAGYVAGDMLEMEIIRKVGDANDTLLDSYYLLQFDIQWS